MSLLDKLLLGPGFFEQRRGDPPKRDDHDMERIQQDHAPAIRKLLEEHE